MKVPRTVVVFATAENMSADAVPAFTSLYVGKLKLISHETGPH